MATKLRGALKRELTIGGKPYVLTIDAERLKLVPKGKRKGRELAWRDLVSGEAALAVALNASLMTARPSRAGAEDARRDGRTRSNAGTPRSRRP
jgi:hypothetical protein